jgi:hypothetical protein
MTDKYKTIDELKAENDVLKKGIIAVRHLINESYGVDLLHLNGDISAWDELEEGGRFEEWLIDFNKAEKMIRLMGAMKNERRRSD